MGLSQYIDQTLLKSDATEGDIDKLIAQSKKYNFASVVVNPYWVKKVHKELIGSRIHTTTVIGFPLGANTTTIKVSEAEQAIFDGADEIDIVMNIGELKSGNFDNVENDLKRIIQVSKNGGTLTKVIIETSLLDENEKKEATHIALRSGADFVKTSTGFVGDGANVGDVRLIKNITGDNAQVKASGGIHTRKLAEALISAGATRIGTSHGVSIMNE